MSLGPLQFPSTPLPRTPPPQQINIRSENQTVGRSDNEAVGLDTLGRMHQLEFGKDGKIRLGGLQ